MTAPHNHSDSQNQASGAIDLAEEADFSLGASRVKPSAREFIHADGVEVLEPRVMQVLVALVRKTGQVVSRDQLIDQCWAGRVVGEDAVQRCTTKIRKLAEAHGGFELHTIPRVGYRLAVAESVVMPAPERVVQRISPQGKFAIAATVLVAIAVAVFGVAKWRGERQAQARMEESLTKIEELITKNSLGAAFAIAHPLSQVEGVRSQPRFAKLWSKIVIPMRPQIAEPGAMVYFKPYEDIEGEWIYAGTSPIKEWIDAPRFSTLRVRVEKPGFRTGFFTIAVPGPSVELQQPIELGPHRSGPIPLPLIATNSLADNAVPENMVMVPRTDVPVYLWGWIPELFGGQRYDIPAFAIAKYEVTNREFKEFVDGGGYEDPRYWLGLKFSERDRPLTWQEARARFVDATNRPGPAGWRLSTYPRDQADFPVGGISWYEAIAYARFRGQALPTIHHWMRAGFSPLSGVFYTTPAIAAASHFEAQAPVSAHAEVGLGPWGTYHMFGNMREWVANRAGNEAVALGSSWPTSPQSSLGAYAADPITRALDLGIRLMQQPIDSPLQARLREPIQLVPETDLIDRDPVSDEAFNAMRFQFSTAKPKPIEIEKQEVQRSELFVVEEVTLKFADDAPMTLHIAWPTANLSHPLQAVVFGPGGNCCFMRRDNRNNVENLREVDFVANSGRVLVMPVWAGSYERFDPLPPDSDQRWDRGRKAALAWHRDLSTTINYLESLEQIDKAKIGYIGYSSGASSYGLALAIESRVKAAVFVGGAVGMHLHRHPMADLVNYAPRITIPVLMLNGRYDQSQPFEKPQRRLLELLGTRHEDKQRIVYDMGHFSFGSHAVAAESSNWFDKYLGPVR